MGEKSELGTMRDKEEQEREEASSGQEHGERRRDRKQVETTRRDQVTPTTAFPRGVWMAGRHVSEHTSFQILEAGRVRLSLYYAGCPGVCIAPFPAQIPMAQKVRACSRSLRRDIQKLS